ncbi:uncharacterized protein [Ptychodera flava]|uniref:uncharacterized protein n=1 Tax=Ptychodera flava TaxID=63121 RepID=UPI00396AAA50
MFGAEKRHGENESELRSFEVFNKSTGDEKYSYADNSVRGSDAVRTTRALGRVPKIGHRAAFGTLQNVIQAQISRLQRRKSLTLSSVVTGRISPTESEVKTETGVQTDEDLSYTPVAYTEVVYQQDSAVRERIGGLTGTFQENDHIGTTTEKGSTLYETSVDQSTLYNIERNSSLRNDKWGYFSKESDEPNFVCVQEVRDESTEPENNNISGFHFEEFDEFLLDEREAEEVKNNIDVITLKLAENMKLEEEVNELVADLMREQEGAVGQIDSEGRQSVALREELGQEMKNIVENLNNIPVISMKSKEVISKLRQEVELMNDKIVDLSDKTQKLGLMRGLQTVKSKLLKLVDLMERFACNNADIRTRLHKVEYIMKRAKIRRGIGNIDEIEPRADGNIDASTRPAANLAVTVFDGQCPVNGKQSQTNLVESPQQLSVAEPNNEVSTDDPVFSANGETGSRLVEEPTVLTGTTLNRSVIEEPTVQVEKNPTFQIFPEPQMLDMSHEQTTGKMRELCNGEGPPTMSERQESSSESFGIEIIDAVGDMYDIGDEIFDTDGRISLEMLERSKCM